MEASTRYTRTGLVMFLTTKTFIATGGMTTPIMTVIPIIIPNQMGSYPSV